MKETNNLMVFTCTTESKKIKDYLMEDRGFSSRLVRFIKKEGTVLRNGKKVRLDEKIGMDDLLEVHMPVEAVDADPEDKPLDVLYEDLDLLIVNKPSNIVTHPTKGHPENNLANRVAFYFLQKGIEAKIRFVNRLDRDTTGVVVIAKSKFAHQHLQNQMQDGQVLKIYYGLVFGEVHEAEGMVDLPIGRPSEESIQRSVMEEGKASVTRFRRIYSTKKASLLEFVLETGRTHQIRVHMKAIGHPLLGDELYNPESEDFEMKRQGLHGGRIQFAQPRTGEPISIRAPLPEDMIQTMKNLSWPEKIWRGKDL